MDTKESVGKAAKGLGSLVLILLLMKGFTFSFRSNWLLTIGIIVGGTLFLYFVGLQCIAGYLWKRKLVTIGAIFIGCFFVSTVSENQVVSGLNTVAYFLAGFVLGIPIAWFFLSAGRIAFRIMRHERLVNSGSYTGSTVSYNSNNKWDQERAERERQEREADQRAKARYDARTNQLKAEYDARTADGWGKDSVNTMVKHWPGGGTGEAGRDAHYAFGQFAVYPTGNFEEHLKPFTEAAFHLDGPTDCASAVMPYYTVSYGVDKKNDKNVGNSYSEYLIKDLLRGKYEFKGIVCTDWGITQDPEKTIEGFGSRCYGVQDMTEAERCLLAITNGVDQFGGNSESGPIVEAYKIGCEKYGEKAMRERMELSAKRLLINIFHCGLFEDPYLDPEESAKIVGCEEFCRHGYEAQKKSIVLLKNSAKRAPEGQKGVLPLKKGLKVYIPERKIGPSKAFFRIDLPAKTEDPLPDGLPSKYGTRVASPEEADVALVFIESPACNPYSTEDLANGGNGYLPITLQYRPYTAKKAREVSIAGGDFRENFTNRSYLGKTNTAYNEADLDNILECRRAMGDKPVIVCATVNNPMVMHEFEAEADAIVAEFGVSRAAVLDVVFGDYNPTGRLPIQMPKDMDAVEEQSEDRALDMETYIDSEGHNYDYGYGMNYEGVLPAWKK